MPVERKNLLGEELSAVLGAICDSETGSAHPPPLVTSSPALRMNARTNISRPRRGRVVNSGQHSQKSPFRVSDLFLGPVGRLKDREGFEIASSVGPDLCAIRIRPLLPRGYCDAGRRFVHYENRVHQSRNARLGDALDSSRFGDRQHCFGSQTPPRVL